MTLQEILYPVTLEDFFNNYFEKKHLVIKKNNHDFFNEVLTVNDLDTLLTSVSNHHPKFRIVDHSQEKAPEAKNYTLKNSDTIDPLKFVKSFEEGCTLVMSGLENKVSSLRKLTNELETFFKHTLQTNIYLTPKNSQGFSTHYDTHDVFILQFEGSKTWRIYDQPAPLADRTMAFEKDGFVPGNVVDEFTLQKGDVLYIPRGIVHDAYCTDDNSGHVTTGLLGKTWAEHLAEIILENSKLQVPLRKFTKFHSIDGIDYSSEKNDIIKIVTNIIETLENDVDIVDDFHSKQKSISKGHLLQMMDINAINETSKIKLREKNKIRVEKDDTNLQLKFYDLKLAMPVICEPFLETLMLSDELITINSINCNIDNESKVMMSQELSKIGVLEISN